MAQHFELHPDNPQPRLLKQAVAMLERGGVLAVPTDSSYALVCQIDDKAAADRLRRIRGVDEKHHPDAAVPRPGRTGQLRAGRQPAIPADQVRDARPYTFILLASKEVPRRVSHPQRKTIGMRVPAHRVLQELLALHNGPLLATTLIAPGDTEPLNDAHDIRERYEHQIDGVIDAGACRA